MTCDCHGEPLLYVKAKRLKTGGYWTCAVRRRAQVAAAQRRYGKTPRGRAAQRRYNGSAKARVAKERYDASAHGFAMRLADQLSR